MFATTALAAPTISAPRSAKIGGSAIHITARSLRSARGYALTLAADVKPTRLSACVAKLATIRGRATSVSFTVKIPTSLHCYENNSVSLGTVNTNPGAYHLIVAVPIGPAGFSGSSSFVRAAIALGR